MRNGKTKEREGTLDGTYLMDDHTPDDYSQKQRCHAIMKDLKDKDKRPHFLGGRLRTTDGFVQQKVIREFNIKHKVPDKRKDEVTTDILTMYLAPKKAKEREDKGKDADKNGDIEDEEEIIQIEDEDNKDKE